MVVTPTQETMDKCPIDGNYFVPKAGKKVCSDKCKRLWDSQNRRRRKLEEKLQAEKEVATAEADREAANARRRRAAAEKRAKKTVAERVQYETPAEAAKWLKPYSISRPQIIIAVVLIVIVILLIWGLPNGD